MKLFRSIRSRISFITGFFLVAAVLLCTGICSYIFSQLVTDKITDTAYAQLDNVGHAIQNTMSLTQDLGTTLSRAVRTEKANHRLNKRTLQQWANNIAALPSVSGCGLILAKDGLPPDTVNKFEWLKQAHRDGRGTWDNLNQDSAYLSNPVSGVVAAYSCPLYDHKKNYLGEGVIEISRDYIASIIDNANITQNSFSQLVSKQGELLINNDAQSQDLSTMEQFLERQECGNPQEVMGFIMENPRCVIKATINGQVGYYCFCDIPRTNWKVFTFVPRRDLFTGAFVQKLVFMILGILVLIVVAYIFTRSLIVRSLDPLNGLSDASKAVAEGDFNYPLPEGVSDSKELSLLATTFDKMRQDISQFIEQEKEVAVLTERVENELRIAQKIQMEMLPPNDSNHPFRERHDFYALTHTAREVGGDLYHYHYHKGHLLYSIGDVSGKGVPAAIYMSQIITQLRYISITSEKEHTRNMGLINQAVCEENTYNMFSTLMLIELDLEKGEIITCNAGHDSPIIVHPDGSVSQMLLNSNIPIGLEKDYTFVKQVDSLEPGSVIFCYTDGVTEAMNAEGELYGIDRLCEMLEGTNQLSPEEIVNRVQQDIDAFVGDAERSDDITMFVVNYKG